MARIEQDAAAISEGFCPKHDAKRLNPEGWCSWCRLYWKTWREPDGQIATRWSDRPLPIKFLAEWSR